MGTTRPNGSLYTNIQNKVATVEFGHPASNSFPLELLKRLTDEFNKLSMDHGVQVIVLKSEESKVFCAGASFDELSAISTPGEGKEFFMGFANVINAMRKCSKLIIGRVHGKAVGGGVGLATACDYALASESASIKLSEFTVGLGPFVIAPAVEHRVGVSALADLTLNAHEWKNAYWAKEKGLYANVFDSIKELDKEVEMLTDKLVTYNPDALKEMKKVFWEGTEHWDELLTQRAEVSGKLVLSEFTKNALKSFR